MTTISRNELVESLSSTADSGLQTTPATVRELLAGFQSDVSPLLETLYHCAILMIRNHVDAKDLIEDTIVSAYASLGSFKYDTSLRGWLFQIMTNTYINAYRKERRRSARYATGDDRLHDPTREASKS